MSAYVKEFRLGEWFVGGAACDMAVLLLVPDVTSGLTLLAGEMAGEFDGFMASVVVPSSS